MRLLMGMLLFTQVVNADLYDRNKWGLDWRRDDAYQQQEPRARHMSQRQCPCDPGDPECPCEIDSNGNYHRVD